MPRMRSFSSGSFGSSSKNAADAAARISVVEGTPSHPSGGSGGGEGVDMATTPASSASDLRLVRTGDTTIPSGVHTRNKKRDNSEDMSTAPAVPAQVKVDTTTSSTNANAAAADGGIGMFSAALATIGEWTSDLMTAPDHLNLTSPTAAEGDDNDREVGNATTATANDHGNGNGNGKSGGKSGGGNKASSTSKLRAAVRSLSPLGRDRVAMNKMKQKLVKAKKAMTPPSPSRISSSSPSRRSPNRASNRNSSSSGAAGTGTAATSKPSKRVMQDQFRTKLQVQTNYDVNGELLGGSRQNGNTHPTDNDCLLYTSPSPRDRSVSRMPSSA